MFETCRRQRTLPEDDPAGPTDMGDNVCTESYLSVYFLVVLLVIFCYRHRATVQQH